MIQQPAEELAEEPAEEPVKKSHSFVCAKCGRTVFTLKLAPYCLRRLQIFRGER